MFSFWVSLFLPQKTKRENKSDVKPPNVTFSCSVLNQNSLFFYQEPPKFLWELLSEMSIFKGFFSHIFRESMCFFHLFQCLLLLTQSAWVFSPFCDSMFLPAELASGIKNSAWFKDDPSASIGRDLLQPGVPASSLSLALHLIFPFGNW